MARQLRDARAAKLFTESEEAELAGLVGTDQTNLTEAKQTATRELTQQILRTVHQLGRIPKELFTTADVEST